MTFRGSGVQQSVRLLWLRFFVGNIVLSHVLVALIYDSKGRAHRSSQNKPQEPKLVNLTDYSLEHPKGYLSFFTFIRFEDGGEILLDNIFAKSRLEAHQYGLNRFADCLAYMQGFTVYESEN